MKNPLSKPTDTRVNFTIVLLDAIADAREESRPIVFVAEPGAGATILAQHIGGLFRPMRCPHHTTSERGFAGELALAAGGVLYLDQADQLSTFVLSNVVATWGMMDANPAQPLVIASVHDEKGLDRLRKVFGDSPIVIRL